jgi:hypothetical protein
MKNKIKPSKTSIRFPAAISIEQIEVMLKKAEKLVNKIGFDIRPEMKDPELLKEVLLRNIGNERLLEYLMETDFGQGYIMGFALCYLSFAEEEINEDEAFI